jgi:phenylalanyl-tRNA synthetase beta chain
LRLGFAYKEEGGSFEIVVPFERLDLTIPEDLVEEVGRIVGYEKIPTTALSTLSGKPEINKNYFSSEKVREELQAQGYSEVFTSVFADKGEKAVLNKVDSVKPYLRDSLLTGLQEALKKNISNKDLLGVPEVKLFEVGTVWKGGREVVTQPSMKRCRSQLLRDTAHFQNSPILCATSLCGYLLAQTRML